MVKIIEDKFPFAKLSRIAEQESWRKEVYRPVYYINKWWARRLGSVFRGIILSAQLDETEDFWAHYYGPNDFSQTIIFDPFMGSGVTIGEGIKLGCKMIGRDINPVAVTSSRAAFSEYDIKSISASYEAIKQEVAPKLLKLFETKTSSDEYATVLYFFLVKIIQCPKCSKSIDLFKRRIFSSNAVPKKDPSAHAICPKCGEIIQTRFDSLHEKCNHCGQIFNPQTGSVHGQMVSCPDCQFEFRLIDAMQSNPGPLAYRRFAKMTLHQNGKKYYEKLNEFDILLEKEIEREYQTILNELPKVPVESGYNTDQILKHNYRFWFELFSDRQTIGIVYLLRSISKITDDKNKLLFSSLFSGLLEFNNLFTSFKGEGTGAVRHMFSNHVLRPELMPIEANIWGTPKSSGSFSTLYKSRIERAIEYKSNPTEVVIDTHSGAKIGGINKPLSLQIASTYKDFSLLQKAAYISVGDSSSTDIPENSVDFVITDPPFFDNVHYSQLADFFYYWLNQLLFLSPLSTTRSVSEVQDTDASLFTKKLTSVFSECKRVLREKGLLIFTYHHARNEGWVAINRAIQDSGFECYKVFPIKAEMTVSIPQQKAKSPIHLDLILVCRKTREIVFDQNEDMLLTSTKNAIDQVRELVNNNITVNYAELKMIIMGHLLCQSRKIQSSDLQGEFIKQSEGKLDQIISKIMVSDEYHYQNARSYQLALFEKLSKYIANNE